jgi:hypothetical protein
MSNEDDLKKALSEQIVAGQNAKRILNDPLYKMAFTTRKAHLFDVFCNTNKDQGDVREEAWRSMQNLSSLEAYFDEVLKSGKLSEDQVKEIDNFKG